MESIEEERRRPNVPWTIPTLIALWVLSHILNFIAGRRPDMPDDPEFVIIEVLQFLHPFLLVALIGYGLVNRSRFAWWIALLWQAFTGGFGILNALINDYAASFYFESLKSVAIKTVTFSGILLPIAVAIVSFVLLLLPTTTRWIDSLATRDDLPAS